jgi:hypothetical protein
MADQMRRRAADRPDDLGDRLDASIVSAPNGRGERPDPGRSGRMQRNPPSAPSSAWNELEVPPRPWTNTIAGPAPSISIMVRPTAAPVTRDTL